MVTYPAVYGTARYGYSYYGIMSEIASTTLKVVSSTPKLTTTATSPEVKVSSITPKAGVRGE